MLHLVYSEVHHALGWAIFVRAVAHDFSMHHYIWGRNHLSLEADWRWTGGALLFMLVTCRYSNVPRL